MLRKKNFILKKIFFMLSAMIISAILVLFASCNDKKETPLQENNQNEKPVETEEPEQIQTAEQEPEKIQVAEPEPVQEPEVVSEPVQEPEPSVEIPKQKKAEPEDEYSRSVGDVSVSRDTFAEDKEKILAIISELDVVMKNSDYRSWLTYLDKESIDYWSRPANLRKAQNRLPVKGLRLTNLQDYFKYVFIPARKGRKVTEIRYVSDTYIKAIEVGEEQDIVYYYFNKINGRWMVNIPPLDD